MEYRTDREPPFPLADWDAHFTMLLDCAVLPYIFGM